MGDNSSINETTSTEGETLNPPVPTFSGEDISGISTSLFLKQRQSPLTKLPDEIWAMIIELAYQPRIVVLSDDPRYPRERRKLAQKQRGKYLFSPVPNPSLVNVSQSFRELMIARGYDVAFDTGSELWTPPIWFNFRRDILSLEDPSREVDFFRNWNNAQDFVTKSLAKVENLLLNAFFTKTADLPHALDGQEKYFKNLKRIMILQKSSYELLSINRRELSWGGFVDDCTCMEIHEPLSNPSAGDNALKELIGCAGKIGIVGRRGRKRALVEHASNFISAYKKSRIASREYLETNREATMHGDAPPIMLPDFNLQTSGSGIIVSHVVKL
ncbi:hypothetical protein GLAREA_06653 [Glarea lozoyensis ATCC 20868]|uniref:2EXR domain-containing protein n=1 Tax=Glarea lozoyensis (strain ATCC 20868 / MF5171) TaxID=1116229 RepID=S3D773_GLAL2|nr:uncharacterized protein GLAREA_06653 [Glarea lozoyensis ATCC 20868]EPE33640.1 hypothetical protein GLAREA_06653 [Glarea lozoyensis ATCC 20868]